MLAGNGQGNVGIKLAVDHHIELTAAIMKSYIVGPTIRIAVPHGKGEHRVGQPLYRIHGPGVITIDDDIAPLGNQICKGVERMLHIRQILEKVQMVGLHI